MKTVCDYKINLLSPLSSKLPFCEYGTYADVSDVGLDESACCFSNCACCRFFLAASWAAMRLATSARRFSRSAACFWAACFLSKMLSILYFRFFFNQPRAKILRILKK